MAEKVIIRVSTDGAKKTLQELSSIQSKVDELNKSSVSIKLNSGSGGKGGGGSAAKEVQDLSGRVAELTKGMRIAKETTTEFSNAATKNAIQWTNDMKKMVTVTEQGNRTMIQTTQKYEKVLTDQAKAAHTAEVQSKALSNAYGDLIDHQEKIVDGQVVQAMNKYRDAAGNVTTVTSKLDGETVKVSTSIKSASEEAKKMADNAELAAKRNSLLGDSLDRIVAKIVAWQVINAAVAATIRSFKEALQTMQAVDSELVQVRKVTGFTADEMKRVEEQAYKTASAYGVAADAYLESVAAFARAGYKEQSTELAELSTKTQIVGDTTAEIANQFLLSVDAAYQYKGSIAELTKVLDGANEIDNKYATSIEKIAEGMGIVAPVAKQVNVNIDELAAAIGTITAVTQRSGSEAARALRALFLNIVGDTKTEIDEGVTWTTGEIEGLQDVIKLYAKDAYDAAKATGEVLNPMKAIEGLAKSMKDGILTADKLTQMVSDIGGKLRTSQLLAIIQNWDMYQSMLVDYGNAIGSADKEVSNALDSWERKTNQLKNAWTEFISHLIETKAIKGGIDVLTTAVKLMDSQLGKAVVTAGLLIGAFAALNNVTKGQLLSSLQTLVKYFLGVADAETLAAGGAAALNAAFLSIGIVAVGAAVYALYKHFEKISKEYETQKKALDEIESKYNDNAKELETLRSRTDELTDAEKERLAVLELENYELDKQQQKQREQTFEAWNKNRTYVDEYDTGNGTLLSGYQTKVYNLDAIQLENAKKALMELDAELDAGQHSQKGYNDGLKSIAASIKNTAENIKIGQQAGAKLSDEQVQILALYEYLTKAIKDNSVATKENADATGEAAKENSILATAMEEVEKKSSLTYGTIAQLDKLYPGFSKKILDVNGNLTKEGEAALKTKSAFYALISEMIAANNTGLSFSGQIDALYELAIAAGLASESVAGIFGGLNGGPTFDENGLIDVASEKAYARASANPNRTISNIVKKIQAEFRKDDYAAAQTGGGGGSGKSAQENALDARKEAVALLKAELNLMKERGDSTEKQVALMRQIQNALHDEAEKMREIEGESANVKALSAEWWKYENEIADIQEKIAKQLKEDIADVLGDIVDSLQASADAMTQPLQDELDALNAQRDAVNDRREEEEKILAVEKARIALENAQRERTVRQYNAATGQWEWVANAKNVEQAQKNLIDAENALQKYREEQAYNLQKENLEKQITSTNSAFDALKDAINEVTQAIKDGKMSYEDAYAYIKAKMKDIYDNYGLDLTSVLTDSVNGILDVDKLLLDVQNETNRLLLIAKMQANSAEWHSAGEDRQKELHDENVKIGTALGWTFNGDGTWLNEKGEVAYFVGANGATGGSYGDNDLIAEIRNLVAALAQGGTQAPAISMQTSIGSAAESAPATTAAAAQTSAPATAGTKSSGANVKDAYGSSIHLSGSDVDKINALAPGTPGIITLSDGTQVHKNADGTINVATGSGFWAENASLYDSGGILRGIGGIKATRRDEMVLNPDMTQKLLTAEMNGAFDKLMGHLGIVTAAANNLAGFGGGLPSNSIGTQNNGDSYNFGNITLSEREAKAMTVYDLAQMSRNLGLTS